ncbi:MAG TPA: hypothetical protein VGQ73_05405, partial [Gemmatimonadales bacterium]|nr:hypothetical protein [Gemmatimonadales bacterium]
VGLAARVSTLGVGAELSFRPGRNLGIRLGGNYFQLTKDATIEDISYHATPHLENGTAIVDLHPFGGSFHLSGGLLLNYNEGELVATLAHDIQIGDSTYTPQQVGSLTGTVSFNRTAPYLGLGFAGQGRIAVLFDLGVGFTGKPKMELVGETNLTGQAKTEFDANVDKERVQAQAEIDKHKILKYHPVVSLGIKLGF